MIDNVFLLNTHIIFIAARFDIHFPLNLEYIKLVKQHFDSGGENTLFLDDMHKIHVQSSLEQQADFSLSRAKSVSVSVDQNFMKLYSCALSEIIHLLQEGDFDQAYDVIDAFHWLPETVANGGKVDYVSFFTSMIIPLSEKWGTSFVEELYSLLRLNWLSKIQIRRKLVKSQATHRRNKKA